MNNIIAVVGLPGAGKSVVVDYLKQKGFQHVYLGQPTFDELEKRCLAVTEENERCIREEIRAKEGMDAYAKRSLPSIKAALQRGNVVVESMYSWEEYLLLKSVFKEAMRVAAVYANTALRQKRMAKRKIRPLTAEEFESRERAQIEKLNIAGPIAKADYTLVNTGTIKALYKKIDKMLGDING